MTTTTLTDQVSFACLRQQAERLEIPGWAKMRKSELLKAISQVEASADVPDQSQR
jgi:hypothetical protein